MKLSIIIVSYNTSKLTISCIESIEKFAPTFRFEIIVVDNGSSDNSVSELRKLGKRIVLVENKLNLGFSKANNIGIKRGKGEYFLLLNTDTLLVSRILDELVSFAEENDLAGVVAPRLLNVDKTIQPSCYRLPTLSRAVSQYWFRNKGVLDKYSAKGNKPVEVESVVGAAFLITPKAIKRVGLLNEKYFMYFEDLDYCRLVLKNKLKVYYLPNLKLIHLHGASGNKGVGKLLYDSSKKYFGITTYFVYTFILWSGQKFFSVFD